MNCECRLCEIYPQSDCIRCHGTGVIELELAQRYQRYDLIERLASRLVDNQRKSANTSEDGEPWSFHAAESGMTELEFNQSRTYAELRRVEQLLDTIPEDVVKAICEIAGLEIKEAAEQENTISVAEKYGYDDDSDIPF